MQENSLAPLAAKPSRLGWFDDVLLLGIMAVLAGCGLIYEYLLSHYAGRILGALEAAIYTMIGLMIVSMGLGAFAARKIRDAFTGFVILELTVALCGSLAILITAAVIGFGQQLPLIIASTLGLPPDQLPDGGVIGTLQKLSEYLPYMWGVLLGLMIGMEIPLIARVRQSLSDEHLLHNAGTIYGADYIGAGIGAAIWVGFMLAIDIQLAAALTASFNLLAGFVFIWRFWPKIRQAKLLLIGHLVVTGVLLVLAIHGPRWEQEFNNLLYKDKVVYSKATRFQQLTFTERLRGNGLAPVYALYINGRLQFSSIDEHIYHTFLVHPTLAASARHNKVLIIGGGDGLGLKQVLRWQPEQVTLLDLDADLVKLFKSPDTDMPANLTQAMLALNGDALNDPRVTIINDDAFNGVDKLIATGVKYDAIIVDLPDPSHPDLNKLYSDYFYRKLKELMSSDGALTVQSTSPYHAPKAFISVAKTLVVAGFDVKQYHHNVPSFGEWGWSIATAGGRDAQYRLAQLTEFPIKDDWLTLGLVKGAFEFPANFYLDAVNIKPNELGSLQLYHYHLQAWSENQGIDLF
ncbi:polyamine aminopropyltransferase [Shewanella sp. JNE10-2]|uniref:polyamine aminopropyltransferase n=1 Tax=unclassified Shewanella TaxID=196818 RepID=UPI002003750C|nr:MULTISPECIES: polyamine aminopropyltransferase [unclassified Shewanella]MCK7629177.1 polyamine aminopropyltransferase [Shewanella sp. JNE9-1]MCK7635723.1 polyamine aminopropyltransferase [Shewanella sp. JNE17]MCK7646564.1 polyamine aminopropyltransferase [Shewanella sp. JNE3-1]MCK7650949.1 polyamine aminopropyltransferase [Shewanella sp. JNE8]MCK7652480.1 polyamine aminopropyltransferase [Shewanella sp. JNE4-1]